MCVCMYVCMYVCMTLCAATCTLMCVCMHALGTVQIAESLFIPFSTLVLRHLVNCIHKMNNVVNVFRCKLYHTEDLSLYKV